MLRRLIKGNRLYNSFETTYSLFKHQESISKNVRFKEMHKERRCFIIGNGPSLKKQNLLPLEKELTFVMNAFWKHPIISPKWQPTYYCFADSLYFDGSPNSLNFFKKLGKKIKESIYFTSLEGKNIIEKHHLLPKGKTNYVTFGSAENIEEIDLTSLIPSVQSTSQLAIEVAIYMGCTPIYLLGMDHDWLSHRGLDKHFYPGETINGHSGVINDLSTTSYKSELESCLRLWNIYEDLREMAKLKGIQIFNASESGFLDVFERKKYETVVSDK